MSFIIKENVLKMLYVIFLLLSLPLVGVLLKILFTYGNYVGTQARIIAENGVCR